MKSVIGVLAAAGVLLAQRDAGAQYLMVVNSTTKNIVLLSAADGHVVNDAFIVNVGQFPKEAIQVNNEIWISDQTFDAIHRYTAGLTPAFIGSVTGQFDNIRGMCKVGNFVYVTNGGSAGPADADRIYKVALDGQVVGEGVCVDPFDVVPYAGGLLAAAFSAHDLVKFDLSLNHTGDFVLSGGAAGVEVSYPQQVWPDPTDGSVWVASSIGTYAILKFDSTGTQVYRHNRPQSSIPRGIAKLGNGLIIFCDQGSSQSGPATAGSIRTLNPATEEIVQILCCSPGWQYINTLDLSPLAAGCQPADIANDQGTALNDPGRDPQVPNGGVNEGDYNCFFAGFFDASVACDIADDQATALPPFGTGGTGGVPNGGVNEGDYNCFFQRFFDGC